MIDPTTYQPWKIRDNGKTYLTFINPQWQTYPGPGLINKIIAWWFSRDQVGWPFIKLYKPVK